MQKSMGRTGRGGGVGESSSGSRKQQSPRDGDYETALKLQKMFDEEAGISDHHRRHPQNEIPTDLRSLGKAAPSKEASSKDSVASYPKEIQHALREVQKLIAGVMETTCYKCDSGLMRDFDVHRWFKQWTSTKGQPQPSSICSLTCPKKECRALTCLGCGEKPRMGKFTGKIDGFHLDWCCESGRLFALWSLLCEFDNMELTEQERSRHQVQQSLRQPTSKAKSSKTKGAGSNSNPQDNYRAYYNSPTQRLVFNQADSKTDASIKQMLALFIELLPRRSDESKAVPPALSSMIELSLIQDRIAEFLRNDSLQDATTRAGLYFAVFEFIERLRKHPDTSYLIYGERFVKKQSSGLFAISTDKDLKGKGKARANQHLTLGQGEESKTTSLLACMSKIGIQSESLPKASRAMKSEFRTAAGQDLLEVAERIAELQLSMKSQSTVDPGKNGSDSKRDKDMTWQEYNQKYCVTREENVLLNVVGKLAAAANDLRHSPPNRIKRLVTEASEMETSLPPNIFVKVDEVRPDVMKCLIVGPEGTPYEAGLFECAFTLFTQKREGDSELTVVQIRYFLPNGLPSISTESDLPKHRQWQSYFPPQPPRRRKRLVNHISRSLWHSLYSLEPNSMP